MIITCLLMATHDLSHYINTHSLVIVLLTSGVTFSQNILLRTLLVKTPGHFKCTHVQYCGAGTMLNNCDSHTVFILNISYLLYFREKCFLINLSNLSAGVSKIKHSKM